MPDTTGVHRGAPPSDGPELKQLLLRIDGGPYSLYRELVGVHRLGEFEVCVDRVPPDPFAGPARVRLLASRATASLPATLVNSRDRRVAVEDYLARRVAGILRESGGERLHERPGSGGVRIEPIGPAVLERSVCRISDASVELRLFVDLPAGGRRIHGRQADELFHVRLVRLATSALLFSQRKVEEATEWADRAEDHRALQDQLATRGLVAFVANGSVLPRVGGADEGPRHDGRQVVFHAPDSLTVALETPHSGAVSGLGIPAGVTVIVGGAFHGKSTLLDAIAHGVYPHCPGDGRERVATRKQAVVVRAEDGRAVRGVDISAFLGTLPSGELASDFTTEKASGSTSQAASVVESLEAGASLLLLDEDRAATNFMIRDGRMQRLVPRPSEPIVPFIDRVGEIYDSLGVSTILVTGGSGDYLEVAHTVIRMDEYRPVDATARAREVVESTRSVREHEPLSPMGRIVRRCLRIARTESTARARAAVRGDRALRIGDETIDLRSLEQLAEVAQLRAIGRMMLRWCDRARDGKPLIDAVEALDAWLDEAGLDALDWPVPYDLARPRAIDLAAALNRWRALQATDRPRSRPPS